MYTSAVLLLMLATLPVQDGDRERCGGEEESELFDAMLQAARNLDIRRGRDNGDRAELVEQPLLHFTNVIRAQIPGGADFLWVHRGRPVAISSMWFQQRGSRILSQFLHSLDSGPLVVTWQRQRIWTPTQSGVEVKKIPEAPLPAESRDRRALQMRSLMRHFSASSRGAEQGGRHELQLLPRPIYRYQSEDPNLLDGAIFSFAQGNDSEVLVLLEAHRAEHTNEFAWHYACVRFSHLQLEVSYKGDAVWTAELDGPRVDPAGEYTYLYFPVELPRKRPDPTQ